MNTWREGEGRKEERQGQGRGSEMMKAAITRRNEGRKTRERK
jgi:hypothetical protein